MKPSFTHTMTSCTYRFIPSSLIDLPDQKYELILRQQPQRAKMSVINERDRRPIEPPPILQMQWLHCSPDETKKSLQCPFYFMVANLMSADNDELLSTQDYLAGSTVSSLYRLRDIDDSDGGFFVFGDLYCKKQGHYRLQFSLFEIRDGEVQNKQSIISQPFRTHLPKHYPGPVEATFLSRAFSDQGVKMRIRKEHRLNSGSTRKRKLDVQALMDSQSAKSYKPSLTLPLSSPSSSTPTTKNEPVRIAPYIHPSQQKRLQPYHYTQKQQSSISDSHTYDLQLQSQQQRQPKTFHVEHTVQPYSSHQHHNQKHRHLSYQHQEYHHHKTFNSNHDEPMAIKSISLQSSVKSEDRTEHIHHLTTPPPTASTQEFPINVLDQYHVSHQYQRKSMHSSSSSVSSASSTCSSSPSSPSLPRDHHMESSPFFAYETPSPLEHHVWGQSLPPLKAVMLGFSSRTIPLVLPCPFENV